MINEALTKIEQGIESKVLPKNKEAFLKAVIAGEKIMFDPKTHQNMELVKNPESRKDPVGTVAKGIAGLMWVMFMQSKQTMSYDTLIMSGIVLMTKAIDFAERGIGIAFTPQMIADTTKKMAELLMNKLGISPEQLNEAIQKGADEIQQQHQSGGDQQLAAEPAPPAQPGQAQPTGLLSQAQQPGAA